MPSKNHFLSRPRSVVEVFVVHLMQNYYEWIRDLDSDLDIFPGNAYNALSRIASGT